MYFSEGKNAKYISNRKTKFWNSFQIDSNIRNTVWVWLQVGRFRFWITVRLFRGAGFDRRLIQSSVLRLSLQRFLHLRVIIQGFPHWIDDVLLEGKYKSNKPSL